MKKIIFSMIMLCTMVSAWSYETETETVTISCNGTNTSPFTVDGTPSYDPEGGDYWLVRSGDNLVLKVKQSYYVTSVEFETIGYGRVDECDKLKSSGKLWVRDDGDTNYYDVITFSNYESDIAKVTSITVTYYHVCYGATHHEAVGGTCETKGTAEYWECVCGKKYSNEGCTSEVTDMATLATETNPTNHPDALEEHARVEATCIKDGNVQYWHCSHCNKNFGNENGTGDEITNVVIPKEQGSHNHLTFVAQKAATCTESGVAMNHYQCSDCGKNFEDEACTKQMTDEVVIPAINHKNKTFTEAVAPTTETEGNVAYWHCPDCEKNFEDEGCTNELTEWILEKLVNMMHLDFASTSAPIETEHYLNTTKFNFTDDGDVILTVDDKSVTYDKDMIDKVKLSNGTPAVEIKANQDPDNKGTYYSTFYSSLESYSVPEGFTAYRGKINGDGTQLSLTSVKDGIMTRGEGYILKGTTSSDSIKVTANVGSSNDNELLGTDVATTLSANQYALSLGQSGVGFYLWSGKNIGANKAYLTLTSDAKALAFEFNDEPSGIKETVEPHNHSTETYNLNGIRVGKDYKGIVVVRGKKFLKK